MNTPSTSLSALKPGDRLAGVKNARLWTPQLCGQDGEVEFQADRISRVGGACCPAAAARSTKADRGGNGNKAAGARWLDVAGALVVPGLLDVHMHGAGGGDVLFGEVEQADLVRQAAARGGATALVVVLPWFRTDTDLRRFRASVEAIRASRVPGARIVGIHLETPFINPIKRGGFPEVCAHPCDVDLLRRLIEAGEGMIRVLTLAPELPGMEDIIEAALEANVRVSLGHSEATAEQARRGFSLGADRLTHTFNTMNPFHHREIGLLGAALLDHDVFLEVIADGIHLCPDALRFLGSLFPAERLVAITDSNAGAGMPEGFHLRAVGGEAEVRNGAVRLLDGTLAGSTILMDGALKNLINLGRMAPRAAVESTSLTPARSVGLDADHGSLEPGKRADLAILDPQTYDPLATVVGGEVVWRREADCR